MYQKIGIGFIVFVIGLFSSTFAYKELIIQNIDKKAVRVVKVILDGEHFVVSSVAEDGGATIQELAKKVGGDTAVNGTFFCPSDYSSCGGITHTNSERIFLGDGASWSRHRPDTSIRMVFGFDKYGNPDFVQNNLGKMIDIGLRIKASPDTMNSFLFALGGFPALLLEGEDVTYGYTNYIDSKMTSFGNRNFICSTKDGSTIYMGVVGAINIPQLPAYLKKNFDCRNALNLDAGASTAMVYSGFVLDQGARKKVMDAFVVLDREQYIKLTGITPPSKTPYKPDSPQYQLTDQDRSKVKAVYDVLYYNIRKNGSTWKTAFISMLRSSVTDPKIIADPQKQAIIKDLLWRMFVISSL